MTFPSPGDHPVWAWVDCDDNVAESDDTNNKLFDNITVGQSDLRVDSISLSNTAPNINDNITVTTVISNIGSVDAGPFRISFVDDSTVAPTDGCELDFDTINGLAAGASTTVNFQVSYAVARPHRMWVWVDSCDYEAEAREDNNQLSREINVGERYRVCRTW